MLTEFVGLMLGLVVLTAKVGVAVVNPFDGVDGKDVEKAYASFCVDSLKGKWNPQSPPADSCPGGKWSNVIAAPK